MPRGTRLSPEQVNELERLWLGGWVGQRIADRLGVHKVAVYRWIRQLDLKGKRGSASRVVEYTARTKRRFDDPDLMMGG